jgi:transcriptional regulator with PAS, ATPase and Fis domain
MSGVGAVLSRTALAGPPPAAAEDTFTAGAQTGPLVGASAAMSSVHAQVRRLARRDVTVILTGESGTGKELVARTLHATSERRHGPFVAVNCAALPETLVESELFGYERGAFTGALRDRPGKLALADGGTLFLDEIESMSLACQAKLLRAIETQSFEPLGGERPRHVSFRLIAATNEDLAAKVLQGGFRLDFFHRLWVTHVHLPPLRERREDVPALVAAFIEQMEAKYGLRRTVSDPVLAAMAEYPWPGNVRELRNIVEHMVALSEDEVLSQADLPERIRQYASSTTIGAAGTLSLRERLRRCEREFLLEALRRTDGNRTRAARHLGISRENLLKKLRKHHLGDDASA